MREPPWKNQNHLARVMVISVILVLLSWFIENRFFGRHS